MFGFSCHSCGMERPDKSTKLPTTRRVFVRAIVVAAAVQPLCFGTASAFERKIRIINDTRYAMVRFYGAPSHLTDWGEDQLGISILKAKESMVINLISITDHCSFDFRAEFDDGEILDRIGINVCEITNFTYY